MRTLLACVLSLVLIACGGSESNPVGPSSPSPARPTGTSGTLTGVVRVVPTSTRIGNAVVTILDGPAAGRTAITDGAGAYRFENVPFGGMSLSAVLAPFAEDRNGVTHNGTATLDFNLTAPVFTVTGTGDTVFDKPFWVSRIQIRGLYSGRSSNWIVYCGNNLIVNELVGSSWGNGGITGTYLVPASCTPFQIRSSSGVNWTFTEVR